MEETISSQEIYKGRILNLRIDKVRLPGGRCTKREIVEHSDSVAIVAIDEDDNVLLVKQFRKPVERDLLEIPAGCIEEGEKPEVAVIREMREETGYRPQKVKRLGGFYSTPGFCNEYLNLYLATDLISDKLHAEDTDEIELVRMPSHEIAGLVSAGSINDAKSVIGLLLYLTSRKSSCC